MSAEYIPIIGAGKARWDHIHVHDLSNVFLKLVEAAVAKNNDPELWGSKGYYFTESGQHVWGELSEEIGRKAEEMKLVGKKLQKQALSKDKALEQAGFEAVSWGLNSRAEAVRARKVLGWKPEAASLSESIPEILKGENERLKKT